MNKKNFFKCILKKNGGKRKHLKNTRVIYSRCGLPPIFFFISFSWVNLFNISASCSYHFTIQKKKKLPNVMTATNSLFLNKPDNFCEVATNATFFLTVRLWSFDTLTRCIKPTRKFFKNKLNNFKNNNNNFYYYYYLFIKTF